MRNPGTDESRRLGHPFAEETTHTTACPLWLPRENEISSGGPGATRKVWACRDHLCLVQRDVEADGRESRDEVAEERTDGLGVAW